MNENPQGVPARLSLTTMLASDVLRHFEELKRQHPIAPAAHGLESELIVSLTSYGPRLPTLHLTLKSLLEQTVVPDQVIVWIAEHEIDAIPAKAKIFDGVVEFRACEDIKSYKKLIFALEEFPDAYIAIADDDVYYHRQWLQLLVDAVDPDLAEILCHVAYRFHSDSSGQIAAYDEWSSDVQDLYARTPSFDLLPIGGGGVLFPPGSLHADVTDKRLFTQLCPHGDDLWLYAMARRLGTPVRKVGPRLIQVSWPHSQDCALWRQNVTTRNDANIQNLVQHFGRDLFAPRSVESRP